MRDLSIEVAQIVALVVCIVLYVPAFITAIWCALAILDVGPSSPRHRILLVLTLLLFATSTVHLVLEVLFVMHAFVWYRGPGGASGAVNQVSYPLNAAKGVPLALQVFTGDSILLLRCHMLWNRNWRIAAGLSVLLAGTLGIFIFVVISEFDTDKFGFIGANSIFPVCLAVSSIQNIAASGLIWWKMQSILSKSLPLQGLNDRERQLRDAIVMILESGAVYTVSSVTYLIVTIVGSNISRFMPAAVCPIASCLFVVG
ncbi:hypothetical protein K488DRAFT_90968 [Vararia minispora EC-137]|uniref:Uncharacterized protein n=1 Tax=Vararia minispora EC-137 TaxID=1314806 RepID=A0ACB8Q6P2_9AGAM|nr:hypothetical protein K488DRAFT_90968 [Vararia minispora EC-137]